ncbi:MAG: hypothetical protein IJ776_09275 [Paludibacteraceae bacterium]|nr:hypothetical protein [Paludibacteraceae bacterium]
MPRRKSINQLVEQRNRITTTLARELEALQGDYSVPMEQRNARLQQLNRRYDRAMSAGLRYMYNAGRVTGSIYRDNDRPISQRAYMGMANG